MSTPGDIEARARAIHAARAEVDEMLGFGPAPEAPASRVSLDAAGVAAARADRAEAELDALRVAVREYLRGGSMASYRALAERVGLTVREG